MADAFSGSRRQPDGKRRPRALAAIGLMLASLPLSSVAAACPAYVPGRAFSPLPSGPRQNLRLFALDAQAPAASETPASAQPKLWRPMRLQVDPLDEAEILISPKKNQDLDREPLAATDRLTMRVEDFGAQISAEDGLPCKTSKLYEVRHGHARFAYLAACDDPPTSPALAAEVAHALESHTISTPLYRYRYHPNNQLVFRSLEAHDLTSKRLLKAGANADIFLHLDLKHFFTLDLTNDQVESYVETTRTGQLGILGRIQFYLRLMLIKVDLHMATLASFFNDSAHLPMVVDVPVESPDRLNHGSGMLFNWMPEQTAFDTKSARSTIPTADARLINAGYAALAAQGMPRCRGRDMCVYRLPGKLGMTPFTIEMSVPRALVAKGFYPMWVEDVAGFKKAMGWTSEEDPAAKGRVAVYFNISGLAKGQYKMDFWIRLGEMKESQDSCPIPVQVTAR